MKTKEIFVNAHLPLSPSLESLVAQYASGDLGYGMAVLMASYITLSPEARDQVCAVESINGVLLDEAEPAAMDDSAFDEIMSLLDSDDRASESESNAVNDNVDLPAPLRAVLDKPIENENWRFAYPGVQQLNLSIGDNGETVKLLKIKPGKSSPRHTHKGVEATLVLRGAFRDGNRCLLYTSPSPRDRG